MDWFTKIWHSTKCEILQEGDKTCTIKLLECSKGWALPGTTMRVNRKSVMKPQQPTVNTSWQAYSYFD